MLTKDILFGMNILTLGGFIIMSTTCRGGSTTTACRSCAGSTTAHLAPIIRSAIAEPLLSVRRVMRQQFAVLHKMLLDMVRGDRCAGG